MPKRVTKRFLRENGNPMVSCACGCGATFPEYDVHGRKRTYLVGHSNRNKGLERFWSNVEKTESCWLWTGAKSSAGYGQVRVDGITLYAHRLSYEMQNGPLGTGLVVLHSCDNPACVNPEHLSSGTQLDNVHDAINKGRASGSKKFSDEDVREIRKMRAGGVAQKEIASLFDTNPAYISRIVRGERRCNVSVV